MRDRPSDLANGHSSAECLGQPDNLTTNGPRDHAYRWSNRVSVRHLSSLAAYSDIRADNRGGTRGLLCHDASFVFYPEVRDYPGGTAEL